MYGLQCEPDLITGTAATYQKLRDLVIKQFEVASVENSLKAYVVLSLIFQFYFGSQPFYKQSFKWQLLL